MTLPLTEDPPVYQFTKDPLGLTRLLNIFLWISVAAKTLTFLNELYLLILMASDVELALHAGGYVRLCKMPPVDWIYLTISLATIVLFLMWVYRANLNCHGFGARYMNYTPGWAVGCYFVPFACFISPYRSMKEIWKVSCNPADWQKQPVSPLLRRWWGLFLLPFIIFWGQVTLGSTRAISEADISAFIMNAQKETLCSLLEIVQTIITIRLISQVTANQLMLTDASQFHADPEAARR